MFLPHAVLGGIVRKAVGLLPEDRSWAGLEERDPTFLEDFLSWASWVGRTWFRSEISGASHVPSSGPALIVGNHNGGIMVWDSVLTVAAIWEEHGPERAVYGMGHDGFNWSPLLRSYATRFGALRAGHEDARKALESGHLVIVYPGGELDSFRPFSQRSRVVLGGRKGFIQLAIRSGVPIVPVVSAGAQEQYVVLTRGDAIARALALPRRIRSSVFPICLSLPWGLTSGYVPFLPLPAQISISFLPPVSWDLDPDAAGDERIVEGCYREIESLMQRELDRLYEGRLPWIGRLDWGQTPTLDTSRGSEPLENAPGKARRETLR